MRSPRSVAEILPCSFESMAVADVRGMLDGMGDQRETLFVELKSRVNSEGLSKSCAAFANTYGGLLIGGADNDGKLVGMSAPGGEVAMWVKNILRATVLPLPPFRARWLPLTKKPGATGLLLVLVDESSTTPHLLLSRGAIYVRAPGSSDPVPIRDQALLLELTRRGRESRDRAAQQALAVTGHTFANPTILRVGIAPTGAAVDAVRELYAAPDAAGVVDALVRPLVALREEAYEVGGGGMRWALSALTYSLERHPPARSFGEKSFVDGARIGFDCSIGLSRALVPTDRDQSNAEPRGPRPLYLEDDLLPWLSAALRHGLDTVGALGGHGDASIYIEVGVSGRQVFYAQNRAEPATNDIALSYWAPVEADDAVIERLVGDVRSDVFRALGLPPSVLAAQSG